MAGTSTPARRVAWRVLLRVGADGAWSDRVLDTEADRESLSGRERAFATALVAGSVQRRITLDHFIARLAGRPAAKIDAESLAALQLGLQQVLFMDGVADHAAVSETVSLLTGRGARSFVNANLRRAVRERDALLGALTDQGPADAALRHGMPEWITTLWWEQFGAGDARRLVAAQNAPGETAARPNRLLVTGPEASALLRGRGCQVETAAWPDGTLLVKGPLDRTDPSLGRAVVVQARGARLAADVLGLSGGERVLELCAAPGGKTLALAEAVGPDGSIVAVEANAGRAQRLSERLASAGAARRVEVRQADGRDVSGGAFDAVLVDPPCSGLGILRSRPDRRHHASAEGIDRLVAIQRSLARAAVRSLREGGILVWCTCTTTDAENGAILRPLVEQGLLEPVPWEIEPPDGARPVAGLPGAFTILPDPGDGFVICRLRRTALSEARGR